MNMSVSLGILSPRVVPVGVRVGERAVCLQEESVSLKEQVEIENDVYTAILLTTKNVCV